MKKKLLALTLTLMLTLLSAVPVLAYSDVTWSSDTTLTQFGYDVENAVVKSGVTVTLKEYTPDPMALIIHGSLTVEDGGKITGAGSIMFYEGAKYSGIDLYYDVAGKEKLLDQAKLDALIAQDSEKRCVFYWFKPTQHYVLYGYNFAVDPFDVPKPADGGNSGAEADPNAALYLKLASQLKALGLFKGAGTNADGSVNFALERPATRVEAVVLLIRLLGKEAEANATDPAECPFSDVPVWAREELAYAYKTGLAGGVGQGKFGMGDATPQQFLTFVLRAMGYSDSGENADFSWRTPEALAMKIGIIAGEHDLDNFSRGSCVRIMEAALRNSLKAGGRLWEKLVANGVFTEAQYKSVMGAE